MFRLGNMCVAFALPRCLDVWCADDYRYVSEIRIRQWHQYSRVLMGCTRVGKTRPGREGTDDSNHYYHAFWYTQCTYECDDFARAWRLPMDRPPEVAHCRSSIKLRPSAPRRPFPEDALVRSVECERERGKLGNFIERIYRSGQYWGWARVYGVGLLPTVLQAAEITTITSRNFVWFLVCVFLSHTP